MKNTTLKSIFKTVALFVLIVVLGAPVFEKAYAPKVTVSYGNSTVYSKEEIDLAVQAVQEDFKKMNGCKLFSLSYAGDKRSIEDLSYINEFAPYDDCLVFNSEFRSPLLGGGAWEANTVYKWTWYLGRTDNGKWEVVQKGYD